ncbi:MAG: FAD:protein FMN transferase [Nitrospirae bacterium]|nr:FAD:protein FMN transferase [Nitrospirota bacterium]
MGGPWEIIAHGPPDHARRANDAAFHEIARIESLLSRFRPDSEISRINKAVGPRTLPVDPEVCGIIALALRYAERTGGAFDPTAGALGRLWRFGPDGPRSVPPDKEQIRTALKRVDYRRVFIDEARCALTITQPGLEFDLGGMGKGYAVDRAVAILRSHGIERGFVSCGSTSFALGAPPLHDAWRIGIRDPRRPDRVVRTLRIRDRAVSTSGAHEQFFICDGKRYGHICDPRTGYPTSEMAGVNVIAPTATEADILSTAAFVLGIREGVAILESQAGVEGCFVKEEDGDLSFDETSGWNEILHVGFQDGLNRRRFLAGLLSAFGLLVLKPYGAAGAVYLTEEEAVRRIFPEGREFAKETVTLTAEQKAGVGGRVGKRIEEESYTVYRIVVDDPSLPIGYGVVLNVIGKERPITFMIGVSPQARIIGIEVMIYRESQGSEIRSKRFMKQFMGKTVDAPLKLGRDIDGISGATLSSRSTAYAVKKALALTQVVYGINAEKDS